MADNIEIFIEYEKNHQNLLYNQESTQLKQQNKYHPEFFIKKLNTDPTYIEELPLQDIAKRFYKSHLFSDNKQNDTPSIKIPGFEKLNSSISPSQNIDNDSTIEENETPEKEAKNENKE